VTAGETVVAQDPDRREFGKVRCADAVGWVFKR